MKTYFVFIIILVCIVGINAQPLVLNCAANQTNVCPGQQAIITASITGGVPPYTIYLENNITSLPMFVYPMTTTWYTIKACDNFGNCDTEELLINIHPIPVVAFSIDTLSGCAPLEVQFTSFYPGETYLWDFGDGGSDAVQNPKYIYQTPGVYTVSHTIINDYGCSNTLTINDILNVSSCGSITETIFENIKVSPNPFKNELFLQLHKTLKIEILDIMGHVVLEQCETPDHNGSLTLELSKIPSGSYFVKIVTTEGIVIKKVIKE